MARPAAGTPAAGLSASGGLALPRAMNRSTVRRNGDRKVRAVLFGSFVVLSLASPAAAFFDPPGFDAAADRILAGADVDGDGLVTRGEMEAASRRFRSDAKVQVEHDWTALLRMVGVDPAARRLDVADVGRGVIHLQELADADGDGVADLGEIRSFLHALPDQERLAAGELLAYADANADGTVDDREIAALKTEIEEFLAARLADEDAREGDALLERTSAVTGWMLHADASAENARFRFEHAAGGSGHAAVRDLAGGPKRAAAASADIPN